MEIVYRLKRSGIFLFSVEGYDCWLIEWVDFTERIDLIFLFFRWNGSLVD